MIRAALHMSAWPDTITLGDDGSALTSIMVTNTSEVVDAYVIEVLGVDPAWTEISEPRFTLFPGATQSIDIKVSMPLDTPAAERSVTIIVRSEHDPLRFESAQVGLVVPPRVVTSVALDPSLVNGGSAARFGLIVSNQGNAAVSVRGVGADPEDLATFDFDPPVVEVAPGRTQAIEVTARGGRAWFGQPRARTFEIGLAGDEHAPNLGTFLQRPRVPRWLILLLGLLTVATIFAFVLSRTFNNVVDDAKVDDDVIDEALVDDTAGGSLVIPANPGTITGVLTTSTGSVIAEASAAPFRPLPQQDGEDQAVDDRYVFGVAAVQIEAFLEENPEAPVATAATDRDGRFTIANLKLDTPYLLLLSGAGYPEVWFKPGTPGVADVDDAEVVEADAAGFDLGVVQIGGIPVTIEGQVAGDAAGATIQLVRPGLENPEVDAILAETTVAPDGSFVLPDIPSPAELIMVVSKPGFATARRAVTLQPGDELGPISVELAVAQGTVEGLVQGPGGPQGGVKITATDGTHVVETLSYTIGDEGRYTLRNLTTPGRYTITASFAGFQSTSASVTLEAGQTSPATVDFSLVPATGQIVGQVLLDGQPSSEIEITITGGDDLIRTIRPEGASAANPGRFDIRGLPIPGSYTLTFAGDSVETEVRVANIDVSDVSFEVALVNLRRSERTVSGTIIALDSSGDVVPFPQAEVILSDGADDQRTVLSANDPSGRFVFTNVPPGPYTLSVRRAGALASVLPITVEPGVDPDPFVLELAVQASIVGYIDTGASECALVAKLFVADDLAGDPVDEITIMSTAITAGDPTPQGSTTTSDVTGSFTFEGVEAPVNYIVAIATPNAEGFLATTSVRGELSQTAEVGFSDQDNSVTPTPVGCP